jgi:hypothetical protein
MKINSINSFMVEQAIKIPIENVKDVGKVDNIYRTVIVD